MTIAILGGRFDPPHWGHFWVAQQVLDQKPEIDEFWFMPAAQHQWKAIEASAEDRLAMLASFIGGKFKVSELELHRPGISYTIDTLKAVKASGKHTIYWVVGSDIPAEFSRWGKAEELPHLATFLVFPRDPYVIPPTLPEGFQALSSDGFVVTNLSSTIIRRRIVEGKAITGFVHEKVERYIQEKGLYRKGNNEE